VVGPARLPAKLFLQFKPDDDLDRDGCSQFSMPPQRGSAGSAGAGEGGGSLAFVGTIRAYSACCPARNHVRAEKSISSERQKKPKRTNIRNEPGGSFLAIDLVDRPRQQLTRLWSEETRVLPL